MNKPFSSNFTWQRNKRRSMGLSVTDAVRVVAFATLRRPHEALAVPGCRVCSADQQLSTVTGAAVTRPHESLHLRG